MSSGILVNPRFLQSTTPGNQNINFIYHILSILPCEHLHCFGHFETLLHSSSVCVEGPKEDFFRIEMNLLSYLHKKSGKIEVWRQISQPA